MPLSNVPSRSIFTARGDQSPWRGPFRALWLLCALVALQLVPARAGSAFDEATLQYLEGLRQRYLFQSAEGYCLHALRQQHLPVRKREMLTLELARTFSAHARVLPPEEADELWNRARQTLDDYLQQHPNTPGQIRFELARAMIPAARGEALRWQVELSPWDRELKARSIAQLDAAASGLNQLEEKMAAMLRRAINARETEAGQPTPYELRSLLAGLQLQLAGTLADVARLREKEDPERTAALLDADQWLRRLAGGREDEEITILARLQLAEITRLRGDLPAADRMLNSVEKQQLTPTQADATTAHRVRWLLDSEQPHLAAQRLIDHRRKRGFLTGELGFLSVRATLAMREIATSGNDAELAGELFDTARSQIDRIRQETGGFWAWRAGQLLTEIEDRKRFGSAAAPLIREAAALYQQGRTDASLKLYATAAKEADAAENKALAAELRYTAASILLQSDRLDKAARLFLQVADQSPDADQAATAHLLHAWSLGRSYDAHRTKSNREAYTQALLSHRERFAGHPSSSDALWMLGLLAERRLQVSQAIQLYLQIPADHPRSTEARTAVARCFESILNRLRERGQSTVRWEQAAASRLREYTDDLPAAPAPWNPLQAELALRTARIALQQHKPDYELAGQLVTRVVQSAPQTGRSPTDTPAAQNPPTAQAAAPGNWPSLVRLARQMQIVCLAGLGRPEVARQQIDLLGESSAAEVLEVLDGLSRLAETVPPETSRALGDLQLAAGSRLQEQRDQLSADQQNQLDRCLAEACLATNQPARAIELYQSLLQRQPDNRELLETAGRQLSEFGTPQTAGLARELWRKLEALHQPGSLEWLKARYEVASAACLLREYDECRKLIRLTRVIYPRLGDDPALREKFDRLSRKLDRATGSTSGGSRRRPARR